MSILKPMLLSGSALLLVATQSFAQQPLGPQRLAPPPQNMQVPPPMAPEEPGQLPAYKGRILIYTLTPRGDIDGFVLADGTEVKTPPNLSTEIAYAVKPGDAVTVRGLKAASLPLIEATQVTADGSGTTIVDNGPEGPGRRPPPPPPRGMLPNQAGMTAGQPQMQGRVRMALHGPRGEVNGALLEDGTILRLPPVEAASFAASLQPGQTLYFSGDEVSTALGKVVDTSAIGTAPGQLVPLGRGRPRG